MASKKKVQAETVPENTDIVQEAIAEGLGDSERLGSIKPRHSIRNIDVQNLRSRGSACEDRDWLRD